MSQFTLDVRGEFACFSRPELSVERFSYPCPTPSAARGVFDAIFLKPEQFHWQIEKIEILHPVSYIALRRNEVKETISLGTKTEPLKHVATWMVGKQVPEPILADADKGMTGTDEKGRTQRQTMALRDVRYRLHARIRPWPGRERDLPSLEGQFRRRAAHGKCFTQPYLGQREFVAYFRLAEECPDQPNPVPFDEDIGWMLYDVFDLSRPGSSSDGPSISVFRARIQQGVLDVPACGDAQVRKVDRLAAPNKETG